MSAAAPSLPTSSTKAVIILASTPVHSALSVTFMDENALSFNVDISGAPGTQWPELRQGPIRPRLNWQIEKVD